MDEIVSKMYQLNIYDARTTCHRNLRFNSVDAAVRFIKEVLNQKDMKLYVARLQESKKLDKAEFGKRHKCLYTYYGDIDLTIPSAKDVEEEIKLNGKFEYRLGTSDPMFYDGYGCVYFKLKNECREYKLTSMPPTDQLEIQSVYSKKKSNWLTIPSFRS